MIDLHTHTFNSDGVLLPSEMIRRAVVFGYRALGITDHSDESNLEELVRRAVSAAGAWADQSDILVLPGVEITHVGPRRIAGLAARARQLGASLVVVHGETITEPVEPGTNAAAVRCPDVDILAHPGLITPEDARAASETGVYLEITTRKGHSASNGHVAAAAREFGASMVLNTDAHEPGDLVTKKAAWTILRASGLNDRETETVFGNSERLLERILGRSVNRA